MRDFSEDRAVLTRRVSDASGYLKIDDAPKRPVVMEKLASASDLWDDADNARKVTSELSAVQGDVQLVDELETRVSDAETLYELAREEGDDSLESEIEDAVR